MSQAGKCMIKILWGGGRRSGGWGRDNSERYLKYGGGGH